MHPTSYPLAATAEGVEPRAAAWLAARAEHLDPALASPDTALFSRKALVEVALLVGLRARVGDPLDASYARLLDVLVDVSGRPSYRELVRRDRRALLLYAGTYAALRLCGREDVELRHALTATVGGRYATTFERVPYRHLDLLHTLELAGIVSAAPGVEQVLPLTLLTTDPNVWELTVSDTYAITHAVFYATDFGQRAVAWPAGVSTGSVADLLRGCLTVARAREDADLVGELLMCLTCVRAPVTPAESAARDWLRSWQEPDGRLEGPPGVIPRRLTEADADWGSWATAYHTTIVGALEDLLFRTVPRPVAPRSPARAGGGVEEAAGVLAAAAEWVVGNGASDLRSLAWTARAREVLGDPAGARRLLAAAAVQPGYDVLLRRATRDIAVGVAELADRVGMRDEVLAEVLAEVRTQTIADPATVAPRGLLATPDDLPERDRSRLLVADLVGHGAAPALCPEDAEHAARQLVVAARRAVEDYDLASFAVTLRGLVRLPGLPSRLLRDAVSFLATQQLPSGAVGAPLTDDVEERQRLHQEWTLLVVAALVEVVAAR